VNQLLRAGSQPLQLAGLLRHYVDAPQGDPNRGFQLRVTLVFTK